MPVPVDVSKFVWFGSTGWGGPYCFDFQHGVKEPSVVHWDGYWRRLAPDFASFIVLFQSADGAPPYEATEEERAQALPPRRSPYEIVAASYAQLSEEDRRELERQLRDPSEGPAMSDEQRRKAQELLGRLRSGIEG